MAGPDKLDSRERILAAAEAEFLARGYDRARTQAIADEAGINKALLHYYFGSKDELFAEIFREKTKLLFPRVEALLGEHDSFVEFACAFVDVYVAHLIANPFLPSYLLQIAMNHPELLAQVPNDFARKFVRAFEAAVRSKAIAPHDPHQFIVTMIGMCVMPFVGRNLIRHMLGLDERAFEAFLKGRAEEIKRCVVQLLTPTPRPAKRR